MLVVSHSYNWREERKVIRTGDRRYNAVIQVPRVETSQWWLVNKIWTIRFNLNGVLSNQIYYFLSDRPCFMGLF